MLSKCANPECSNKFRYLHDGKVFKVDFDDHAHLRNTLTDNRPGILLEIGGPRLHSGASTDGGARAPEYFWLCSACSEYLTLASRNGALLLLPIATPPAVGRAAAS